MTVERRIMRATAALLCLAAFARGEQEAPPKLSPEDADFFEKRIRPVLAERCYECHSASARKLKGNLLLDTPAGTRKGGDQGSLPREAFLARARQAIESRQAEG